MSGAVGGEDSPGRPKRRRPKRAPPPYANKHYEVGKGKPPKHSQFKAGQAPPKGSGRPKGSTKATSLQRLLAKTIMVNGADGRRVRKTLGEVIDHKLVEMAAKGDLDAIKLIKQLEIQMRRFGLIDQPSEAEIRQRIVEEEEMRKAREEYSQSMIDILNFLAEHTVLIRSGDTSMPYRSCRAARSSTASPPAAGTDSPRRSTGRFAIPRLASSRWDPVCCLALRGLSPFIEEQDERREQRED